MANVNKVILIGNLGKDPELRHTEQGRPVTTFSVALNEKWKDKSGQDQERTEWVRIVAWNKLADICAQYLSKGIPVYIEGKLQSREWDKDGEKRFITEVVARDIQFLRPASKAQAKSPVQSSAAEGEITF